MLDLPPSLNQRPKRRLSAAERSKRLGEVAAFYGLGHLYAALDVRKNPAQVERFWALLGQLVVHDRIPALDDPLPDFQKPMDQARLVMAVAEVARRSAQKRERERIAWAFRWFLNKEEGGTQKEAARRREMLPLRYQRRKSENSLHEAYYSIPAEARQDPQTFLLNAHSVYARSRLAAIGKVNSAVEQPRPTATRPKFPVVTAEERREMKRSLKDRKRDPIAQKYGRFS